MKHLHLKKPIISLMILGLLVLSGSPVFANSNAEVIAAVNNSPASEYAGILNSYLRDTGRELTPEEAASAIAYIKDTYGIYEEAAKKPEGLTPQDKTEVIAKVEANVSDAADILGFQVGDISTTEDGYSMTVYDPKTKKSETIVANTSEKATAATTTAVADTANPTAANPTATNPTAANPTAANPTAENPTAATSPTIGGVHTTLIAKTGLDNSLFLLVAVLALATILSTVFIYRKKIMNPKNS